MNSIREHLGGSMREHLGGSMREHLGDSMREHLGNPMREHPLGRPGLLAAVLSILSILSACASNAAYRPMDAPLAPIGDLRAAVYLVGDAGENSVGRDAVLAHLRLDLERHVRERPTTPALVMFLGDNIYDVGARPDQRDDFAKLAAQAGALVDAPTIRGVFVPGNHDWGRGAAYSEGRTAIDVQREWLAEIAGERDIAFVPADGCPDPATAHVAADVHVVVIDTEWLLRRPDDDCGGADTFYAGLTSTLVALRGERVLITAHHPLATGGPHGGNVSWFDNGPLVYYLAVKSGLGVQDLGSGRYSAMLNGLRASIVESGTEPLAMAAGHDHSLQVIRMDEPDTPRYQLVSGSASKRSAAAEIDGTRYAVSAHGYMRLDFARVDTRVVVFALDEESDAVRAVFACALTSRAGSEGCPEAPRRERSR